MAELEGADMVMVDIGEAVPDILAFGTGAMVLDLDTRVTVTMDQPRGDMVPTADCTTIPIPVMEAIPTQGMETRR